MNIQDMLARVQEFQAKMSEAQEHLRGMETTVEVGGGMVSVTINGKQEIRTVRIERSVVSPDDVELLEDLIVSAMNKAIEQSQRLAKDELGKVTSGMLPGLPGIPGLDLGSLGV
jgi:nucleoid-associated protein EbfC